MGDQEGVEIITLKEAVKRAREGLSQILDPKLAAAIDQVLNAIEWRLKKEREFEDE